MKTLDLADKYDPLSYSDEYTEGHVDSTPTIKVQTLPFIPKVIVSDDGEEEYFDLHDQRDTIPCPPPYPHPHFKSEVNWGAVGATIFTIAVWGSVGYFLFR